jgi:hypothetical protein
LSFPACKILIYDTGGTLVHTVTTNVLSCNVKLSLTTNPSTFIFTLVESGLSYVYSNIGANYEVKIYMGYGVLGTGDLQLVGKILKITNQTSDKQVIRVYEGKDLGEELERRFKTNTRYQEVKADTIVAALANDLGMYDAGKIDVDETEETLAIRTENYWDILKKISDYYHDGSTKVQKDFYIDNDGKLVWKARPIRTAGVETLTFGDNILSYNLIYDLLPSKNKITVYGAPSAYQPNDRDLWTESLTDWTATTGTLVLTSSNPTPKEGTYCVRCDKTFVGTSDIITDFERTLPNINLRNINKLNFWHNISGGTGSFMVNSTVRLYMPSSSHYYEATILDAVTPTDTWTWLNLPLGDSAVYDAVENPTGIWHKTGAPNWWDIEAIWFHSQCSYAVGSLSTSIDKLYFSPERWVGTAEDPTNQGIYGIREAEYTDENLLSTDECTKRAYSLLMQLKEKTVGVEAKLVGNTNVKRGDRLPLTLLPDNISAMNFDVTEVEHGYTQTELQTTAKMIFSSDIRTFPPQNPTEALNRNIQNLKVVTSEIYSRVVR